MTKCKCALKKHNKEIILTETVAGSGGRRWKELDEEVSRRRGKVGGPSWEETFRSVEEMRSWEEVMRS